MTVAKLNNLPDLSPGNIKSEIKSEKLEKGVRKTRGVALNDIEMLAVRQAVSKLGKYVATDKFVHPTFSDLSRTAIMFYTELFERFPEIIKKSGIETPASGTDLMAAHNEFVLNAVKAALK